MNGETLSLPFEPTSSTSRDAAKAQGAKWGKVERDRARIYEALRRHPMTDEEGCAYTGLRPNTYRPRRGELASRDMIRKSGEKRPTATGSPAAVWEVA